MPRTRAFLLLVLTSLLPQPTSSSLVSTLPTCIQACISESSTNCQFTDIACLCQASAGAFLTDTLICMESSCDLDPEILLTPVEVACNLAGAPIPASVIASAESAASAGGTGTATVVSSDWGSSSTWGGEPTSRGSPTVIGTGPVTITQTTGSSTGVIVYSLTTTGSGKGSTDLGSPPQSTTTPAFISSSGSTTSQYSLSITATSTTSRATTAVAESSTSRSAGSVKPSGSSSSTSGSDGDASDSAPFKDTNSAAGISATSRWVWLGVFLSLGLVVWV